MNSIISPADGSLNSTLSAPVECLVCHKQTFTPFFELTDVPVQDGLLWNSHAEALASPTGNITLAFCHNCGYIGNVSFEPEKIRYDQEYSFSLHFSPTYQNFIHDLAARLVETYALQHKTILEIGCGRGDFLRPLCELGANHGVGIDPSANTHMEDHETHTVTFVQDVYTEKYAAQPSDFVCCRQVLDQLTNPKGFVDLVRRNIGPRGDTVVYFEVPNAASIFEDMLIRNVIYEKSSWFTAYSLARLFELSGFEVLSVAPCYEDGQYLGIEAVPTTKTTPLPQAEPQHLAEFSQLITAFAENYQQKVETWREHMAAFQLAGQRALAWGAGSGAVSFFNTLNIRDQVPYVVDINPNRQGKFIPLTGQEVVAPEFIQEFAPNVVIITNPTYAREIKQQVADLGIICDYWSI